MESQALVVHSGQPAALTTRDLVAMGFRHRVALVISFVAVLVGTALAAMLLPRYESHTEILVHKERVDPVVSPQPGNPILTNDLVMEEDLNSEAELFKSDDVIRPVVLQLNLQKHESTKWFFFPRTQEEAIAKAVANLKGSLRVEALPKTHIVKVTYPSTDPKEAALILKTLDQVYLQKHKELHNPAGQFAFFDQQTKRALGDLQDAEAKLKAFPAQTGTANPMLGRDVLLQKVNDFNYALGQTRTDLAETQERLNALQKLRQDTAPRMLAQERHVDDGSTKEMKAKMLELELKRSDLSAKYQPDYPPLVEVEREIADIQSMMANDKPMSEVTTDRNPSFLWINDETVKDKAQITGDQGRIDELEKVIAQNMDSVRKLDTENIELQDLTRTTRAAEDNYLLYLKKREEARITDALDTTQIVNVSIQEQPSVPMYPAQSGWLFGLIGTLLAVTVSAGTVFMKERMDGSFRTPTEVEHILNVPVLAAVPGRNGFHLNGNGNGRPRTLPTDVVNG